MPTVKIDDTTTELEREDPRYALTHGTINHFELGSLRWPSAAASVWALAWLLRGLFT